ncbi:MAG TPA: TonB-dependent receptor [Candidatus Acidoferrales bacterium]|nr:TonB-dependent receptor [Candidatus Acidoferrales bacterium]
MISRVLTFRPRDFWHLPSRLIALAFVVLATASISQAQGTRVEGIVRDTSGGAVPSAQVELHAKSYSESASADATGAFVFEHVPETSGTILVVANGFEKASRDWTADSSAHSYMEITLQPSTVNQRVLVTAARTPTTLGESPISNIQLSAEDIQNTPALALDDVLRQVPGFSLFRRSSSRIANPTTMGVSLRGLGANGSSRALVLEDGIPINDPFGGWVYWDRVPEQSISSVEIAQEGASSLYGSDAMGGVVQFLTRPAQPAGISIETSYGNQNTPDLSIWAGGEKGRWESTIGADLFHTDGYILVPEAQRGSVDTKAGSEHAAVDLMIGRKIGAKSELFARGWYFDDSRKNGTPDQTNHMRLAQGALGANLDFGNAGTLTLRFYGDAQTYHQTFSSVATGRNSETLTDVQTVPAQGVGGSAVWSRGIGKRQTLVAGLDEHEEIGRSNEILVTARKNTSSGGHQRTTGVFGEDLIQIAPTWLLAASARFDHWGNFDASLFSASILSPVQATNTPYSNRSYNAFSPRLNLVHQIDSHVSWSASVYRAFRAPTLNELYRSFRQGITVTNSNATLVAERLTGGEVGVDATSFSHRLEVRGVFFFNEIIDPIANVQLSVTPPPPATPTLITNQRQNLGRTSAPGFEIDAIGHITDRIQLSGGYQYVDATVISAPAQTSLVGLWVAQVPHSVLTFQGQYSDPSILTFSVDGRMVGKQFDDAPNQFPMGRFFVLDAQASRKISHGVQAFAAVENLFNAKYLFAATPPSEIGLPIAARFGFRCDFPARK